jgi:hypothetical protein
MRPLWQATLSSPQGEFAAGVACLFFVGERQSTLHHSAISGGTRVLCCRYGAFRNFEAIFRRNLVGCHIRSIGSKSVFGIKHF